MVTTAKCVIHINQIFPYAEINKKKKQLILKEFFLYINSEVYTEYGSEQINCRFHVLEDKITREDETGITTVKLSKPQVRKILRIIVHNYEVFTWHEENLSLIHIYAELFIR